MSDTIAEQLARGERAERYVRELLAQERSLLADNARLRAEQERALAALHDRSPGVAEDILRRALERRRNER